MKLNTIQPAEGSKRSKMRVARGIGSGYGKTAGRGHKGQKSRSGGFHKVGFEGGQMPLQRRLPKRGFKSKMALFRDEVRLSELNALPVVEIDVLSLKQAGIISGKIKDVRVIKAGEITKAINLKGIAVTKGAKEAIEAAGGTVS